MKKQGTGNREQETREQGNKGSEPLARWLRQALPPVAEDPASTDDLWPAMLRRMRAEAAAEPRSFRVPWFDWALAAGLVALLAFFPAWIPVLLYYL